MNDLPLVYIIVLSWNHWQVTAVCLRSLMLLTYTNYQVVLVDNHSTDETVKLTRQQYPTVHIIENNKNLGFAAGCNVGIRYAIEQQADYVFLFNNDAIAPINLLDRLISEAQQLPRLGMLTPILSYIDNPHLLWFAGSYRHKLTLEAMSFGPLGPRQNKFPEKTETVDYIFGTAVLIPTQVFHQVGLFDERFFLYYEDMDLCLRMQTKDYLLYVTPHVVVQHGVSASTQTLSTIRYYHKARSSILFFRKHVQGWRWLFVLPYRAISALRTVSRVIWQGQTSVAWAYLRGLYHGMISRSSK